MDERDRHARASAVFLEVRKLPEDQREAALAALAPDEALRREVESLLENDIGDSTTIGEAPTLAGPTPDRIGPYRVIRAVGRGASGHVFLAQQDEPIHRRVAIKIVPHAAVSPVAAARFEVERLALERIEHPNIARVLDAGRTADGLPYLVMDYVEGAVITRYAEEHDLSLVERIELLLDVADAVQHAHQRGVIHRDLKPANILVAEIDGRPVPRVLDFGIAKSAPGGGDTLESALPATSGLPLGTPSYMAPEQTGLDDVDTRADVYALGALLYELVSQRPPIDYSDDPLEVLRRTREVVPPPVSRALRDAPGRAAALRATSALLRDLDCILGRALEKPADRRYATVAALADDLRRLLRWEPIEARPPSIAYRLHRLARRNRALVASAAVVVLAVLVAVAGLAAGVIEANRQRREALHQTEVQRAINEFLSRDVLGAASPEDVGTDVTALDLLREAARRVESRFAERPLIAAEIHLTLGQSFAALSDFDAAGQHLERAVELGGEHAGADAPITVRAEIAAASLVVRQERFEEAEDDLRAAIGRARRILGTGDPALYTALNDLGVLLETMGRTDEAITVLDEALEGRTRLLGDDDWNVLATISNLAGAYDTAGDTERSLEALHEALRIAESRPDPPRMTLLGLCNNLAVGYQDLDRNEEAAPHLRRAAEIAEDLLPLDHPARLTIRGNLAGLEADLGDPERAIELYRQVVEGRIRVLGEDAVSTLIARYGYWNSMWKAQRYDEAIGGMETLLVDLERWVGEKHWLVAQARASLARALLDAGRPQDALPVARLAEAHLLELYGPDHPRTRGAIRVIEMIESSGAANEP